MKKFQQTRLSTTKNSTIKIVNLFLAVSVVIFAFSLWAWWHYVRSNPERTFYGMVENNLKTRGFARQIEQASGNQSLKQTVQLNLTPQEVAHGFTTISQSGAINARVETESISNINSEFVRYTNIETNQTNTEGETLDYSEIVNVWGVSEFGESSQSVGELFSESVLGVIPAGSLTAAQREELMSFIVDNKVYDTSQTPVVRSIEDGRPVYTYHVSVAPEAYIGMLKKFGEATNISQLAGLDPASYSSAQPLVFNVKVDVWSRQLLEIEYDNGARVEEFAGHGVSKKVELPENAIPINELQAKLQAVQQ